MLLQERGKYEGLLPCAGITLIRFNGFDLSLRPLAETPRGILAAPAFAANSGTKINSFTIAVTFLCPPSYYSKPYYEEIISADEFPYGWSVSGSPGSYF